MAQMLEDDNPNEMPRFGQSLISDIPLAQDNLDREVEALIGKKPQLAEVVDLKVSAI